MGSHLTATGRHLPHGITQCYLPPDTSERTPPSPQPVSWYSIYLPRRDGRLSCGYVRRCNSRNMLAVCRKVNSCDAVVAAPIYHATVLLC